MAAADTAEAARKLLKKFLNLADGLQMMDVDRITLGEAANLADAERAVLDAICLRDAARAELIRTEGDYANATETYNQAVQVYNRAGDSETQAAAARAVNEAARDVDAARRAMNESRERYAIRVRAFAAAVAHAADTADRLRKGLAHRHGGIHAAAQASEAGMAYREFYE